MDYIDLRTLVETGRFRSDLYWRLNVLSLAVAPLRSRKDEILVLARNFLAARSPELGASIRFADDCAEFLTGYDWPGNVRELKNFCARLTTMWEGDVLGRQEAMNLLDVWSPPNGHSHDRLSDARIREALEMTGGSVSRAADLLGIHRTTLWRRLRNASRAGRGYRTV
jgi:transcriptional regulator of aroF, aroG, tyrA and aromatic amino acid transport